MPATLLEEIAEFVDFIAEVNISTWSVGDGTYRFDLLAGENDSTATESVWLTSDDGTVKVEYGTPNRVIKAEATFDGAVPVGTIATVIVSLLSD